MKEFSRFMGMCAAVLLAPHAYAQEPDQTLKQQLDATNAAFSERMDSAVMQSIDDAIQQVRDSGALAQALNVGDTAPDFELPDAAGNPVRLSSLLREGPVVLVWYRGNW